MVRVAHVLLPLTGASGMLTGPLLCRFSIHCQDKQSDEMRAAVDSFPLRVDGTENAYHCGFHSEASYGATSYLLVREGGNVLVDSPRFDSKLLKRIQVGHFYVRVSSLGIWVARAHVRAQIIIAWPISLYKLLQAELSSMPSSFL